MQEGLVNHNCVPFSPCPMALHTVQFRLELHPDLDEPMNQWLTSVRPMGDKCVLAIAIGPSPMVQSTAGLVVLPNRVTRLWPNGEQAMRRPCNQARWLKKTASDWVEIISHLRMLKHYNKVASHILVASSRLSFH